MCALVEGDIAAVEAAVEAGQAAARAVGGIRVRSFVIPGPTEQVRQLTTLGSQCCLVDGNPDFVC